MSPWPLACQAAAPLCPRTPQADPRSSGQVQLWSLESESKLSFNSFPSVRTASPRLQVANSASWGPRFQESESSRPWLTDGRVWPLLSPSWPVPAVPGRNHQNC